MKEEDTDFRIRQWAHRGALAFRELMPLHAPLRNLPGVRRHRRAVMSLSTACLGSTDSVLYLVNGMRLWDAERVIRSVVEGTVKFGYLLESEDAFLAHAIEYADVLPEISKLKWHAKAQEALSALGPEVTTPDLRAYRDLLLSPEEAAQIRAIYPRAMRTQIERRWGFSALLDEVTGPRGAFGPTGRVLLHEYSVASHLQHMSREGAELALERDKRSDERRTAIELAHAAKLISDCFHLTWIRIAAIIRFLRLRPEALHAAKERHQDFLRELRDVGATWAQIEYGQEPPGATA